jgi:hypothetical protein
MPAERIGSTPVAIRRFDVVGQDASSGEADFVGHIALAAEDRLQIVGPSVVHVSHVRPPLEQAGACIASSVGSCGLTVDEQLQIALFCDELESEYQAAQATGMREQYVICPHVQNIQREDRTVVYRRFSCVGFALEAYREAGIDIVRTNPARLPLIGLDLLKTQYPRFARLLDVPAVREDFGIGGDGPWPVVLAGYVLNALARPNTEIRLTPYRPSAGDECFPPRSAPTSSRGT